jgi:hypothetical protein
MLKGLVLLGVFLAVTQALVPASGQTPDDNGGKSYEAHGDHGLLR